MPFQIQRSNILAFSGDAIINPTDEFLSGSGGLDAQIHKAAGLRFRLECARRKALDVGEAVITDGGHLPCRYVIHTSAPFWTGEDLEEEQLRSCYRNSLALAAQFGLEELAFPLIGSGTKGFPKELVLRVAAEEISAFLKTHEDTYILLVIHDKGAFQPDPALLKGLESFIRDAQRQERREQLYASMLEDASTGAFSAISPEDLLEERRPGTSAPTASRPAVRPQANAPAPTSRPKMGRPSFQRRRREETLAQDDYGASLPAASIPIREKEQTPQARPRPTPFDAFELDRRMVLDESFSQMLMRKIDERGFKKDSECYTRANIDRRLFSRIRCDEHYHPKKTTALALAVALELSLDETNELLMKAGYSLSRSILSDVIVEYCIVQHHYDIFEINELLFQYDQALLGG